MKNAEVLNKIIFIKWNLSTVVIDKNNGINHFRRQTSFHDTAMVMIVNKITAMHIGIATVPQRNWSIVSFGFETWSQQA